MIRAVTRCPMERERERERERQGEKRRERERFWLTEGGVWDT